MAHSLAAAYAYFSPLASRRRASGQIRVDRTRYKEFMTRFLRCFMDLDSVAWHNPFLRNLRMVTNVISSRSSVSFQSQQMNFVSIQSRPTTLRFKICCSAKKETVDKVCTIVKQQLALPDGTAVTGESKFSELGADSLDTVEIVMGLEEEFNITVDETSAQDIATVQDAANLIEKLVREKTP